MSGKSCSKTKVLIFFWKHTTPYSARKGDIEEVKPIVGNIIKREKPDLIFFEGGNPRYEILSKNLLKKIYGRNWREKIEVEYDRARKYANEECIKELRIDIETVKDRWIKHRINYVRHCEEGDLKKARVESRNYFKYDYVFHFYREKGIVRRIKELAREYKHNKIFIMIGAAHLPLYYELKDAGFEVQIYGDIKQFYPRRRFLKERRKRLVYPPGIQALPPMTAIYVEERIRGTSVKEFWRKVEEDANKKSDVVEKRYDLEILQEALRSHIFFYLRRVKKVISLRKISVISNYHTHFIDEEIIREIFSRIRERCVMERKKYLDSEEVGSIVVQLLKEKGRWEGKRILKRPIREIF